MSLTALGFLEKAAAHQRERAATYDQPNGERSAAAVATAFNAITRREGDRAISESEAWLFLQVLKQVRLFSAPGYHADSAEDNVAYASLLAESKAMEADPMPAKGVTVKHIIDLSVDADQVIAAMNVAAAVGREFT